MITFNSDTNEQGTMESAKVACDLCGQECPSSSGCYPGDLPVIPYLDKLAYAQAYKHGFVRMRTAECIPVDCCPHCHRARVKKMVGALELLG